VKGPLQTAATAEGALVIRADATRREQLEVQEDVTMETAGSNYVANVNLAWWLGGWMRALRRRARSRRRAGASCIVLAVGEQVGVGVGGLIGAPKSVDVGGDLLE